MAKRKSKEQAYEEARQMVRLVDAGDSVGEAVGKVGSRKANYYKYQKRVRAAGSSGETPIIVTYDTAPQVPVHRKPYTRKVQLAPTKGAIFIGDVDSCLDFIRRLT